MACGARLWWWQAGGRLPRSPSIAWGHCCGLSSRGCSGLIFSSWFALVLALSLNLLHFVNMASIIDDESCNGSISQADTFRQIPRQQRVFTGPLACAADGILFRNPASVRQLCTRPLVASPCGIKWFRSVRAPGQGVSRWIRSRVVRCCAIEKIEHMVAGKRIRC